MDSSERGDRINMSTTFIATLVIKPGKEIEFERLQKELSELTHAGEPGEPQQAADLCGLRALQGRSGISSAPSQSFPR
jgi:hypothetical protein